MQNESGLHNTIYDKKYWINGQAQVPLTPEQRKVRRQAKRGK